ncbi:hypothetical protein Tco_0736465 [Tanacetum coccineum]
MWESKDLINNPINWNKPPKNRDGAWHAKIRLIDPDGEEFTQTPQSIPTTRKLSERESFYAVLSLDLTNKISCRKFLIKNEEEIFTDAGDGVKIYPDGVTSPVM